MPNKSLSYIQPVQASKPAAGKNENIPSVKIKPISRVQTGTMTALLHNIELYNKGQRGKVEMELESAIPQLFKVGLFKLFSPQEWMNGTDAGRALVGRLALEYLESNSWLGLGCSSC